MIDSMRPLNSCRLESCFTVLKPFAALCRSEQASQPVKKSETVYFRYADALNEEHKQPDDENKMGDMHSRAIKQDIKYLKKMRTKHMRNHHAMRMGQINSSFKNSLVEDRKA